MALIRRSLYRPGQDLGSLTVPTPLNTCLRVCMYDVYIPRSRYLTVNDSHVLKGKLPSTDGAEGEVVSHLSLSLSLSVLSL